MASKKKGSTAEQEAPAQTITSFKGFGPDWKCRDFQYEMGKTFEHKGDAVACQSGFHACEYPLDVFAYYAPAGNKFAVVEQSGTLSRHSDDSKVASSKISLKVEIGFFDIVKAAIEYTTSRCKPIDPASPAFSDVEYGAASSTGNQGAASSTGNRGAASSTGNRGAASSTGNRGAASSTGYQGAASSTGEYGAASSTGNRGAASSTGYQGAASSTGNQGAASSTGYRGAASSTGEYGAASSTGEYGAASSTGEYGAAMASGYAGRVKGAEGNALFLVFRDDDFKIIHAKAAIVGQDGIKPDTWYSLDAQGAFVEAEVE
ncbi:hypothetical protein [Variovorax paradoxus]|uniref:DUF7666 domain-containing protein n=1 Tax=Variovorax paradoxus TaxID=34073 RepID=UPI001931B22E|nr:hypothetical protein INQ48_20615 [Variovorax paradoxus]